MSSTSSEGESASELSKQIKRQPNNLEEAIGELNFPITIKLTASLKGHSEILQKNEVLTLVDSFRVDKLKCISEQSEVVYVPVETSPAVLFTTIDGNELNNYSTIGDLKANLKQYSIKWVVVTSPFVHNSDSYEVGQILQILSNSRWQSFRKRAEGGLTVIVHPSQVVRYLPSHVKGLFKKCGSFYASKNRFLKDIAENEKLPYLIKFPYISEENDSLSLSKQTLYVGKKVTTYILIAVKQNGIEYEVHTFPSNQLVDFEVLTDARPVYILGKDQIEMIKEKMIILDLWHAVRNYQIFSFDDIGITTYLQAIDSHKPRLQNGRRKSSLAYILPNPVCTSPGKESYIKTALNIVKVNRFSFMKKPPSFETCFSEEKYEEFKRHYQSFDFENVETNGEVIEFDSEGYVDVCNYSSPRKRGDSSRERAVSETDSCYLQLRNSGSFSSIHDLEEELEEEVKVMNMSTVSNISSLSSYEYSDNNSTVGSIEIIEETTEDNQKISSRVDIETKSKPKLTHYKTINNLSIDGMREVEMKKERDVKCEISYQHGKVKKSEPKNIEIPTIVATNYVTVGPSADNYDTFSKQTLSKELNKICITNELDILKKECQEIVVPQISPRHKERQIDPVKVFRSPNIPKKSLEDTSHMSSKHKISKSNKIEILETDRLANYLSEFVFQFDEPAKEYHVAKPETGANIDTIRCLTVHQVIDILRENKMDHHVESFKNNMIDGELLADFTEVNLIDLGLLPFEARKLYCYINGWRPLKGDSTCNISWREKDPGTWTVIDLSLHLKSMLMDSLEKFTTSNDIDGKLIIKLLTDNLLDNIELEHGVTLKSFQIVRLRKYILYGYRPKI